MKQLTLILVILSLAISAIAGQEITEHGVLCIDNATTPEQAIETLDLRELWRIGGNDEEFIFRSIDKVLLANDNNLYILDGLSGIIYVNSPEDGSAIRQMNISGEGPGELAFSNNMFLMEEDEIALLRPHPAKIVCIDYQGVPRESVYLSVDMFFTAGTAQWRNNTLVVSGTSAEVVNGQTFVARFNRYGEEFRYESYQTRSSMPKRQMVEEDDYFIIYKPWTIGQGGELYLAPYWSLANSNFYQINVYDQQGKLQKLIRKEFDSYKRSGRDKKNVAKQKFCGDEGLRRLSDRDIEFLVEDFDPDITNIYTRPNGNIWVQTSQSARSQKLGTLLSYDVFSPQGHFLRQVDLHGFGDGQKDIIYFLGEDRLVVVKGQMEAKFGCSMASEADILEIICYEMQPE